MSRVERLKTWVRQQWDRWRDVIYTSGAEGVLVVSGIVTGILTARLLMPAGKGALTAVLLWPNLFASFASLGTGHGVIYYAGKSEERLGELVGGLLGLALLQGLVVAAAGWVTIPWILSEYSDSTIAVTRLMFVWVPFARIYSYNLRVLHGIGEFRIWNVVRVGRRVLYAFAILLLWGFEIVSVKTVVWGYLASEGLGVLVGSYAVAREIDGVRFDLDLIRGLLGYGLKNFLASLTQKGNKRLDQALMSAWLAPEALGLYRVAVSTTKILTPLSAGFKKILISDVSRAGDEEDTDAMIGESFRAALPVLGLAALAAAVLMPVAVPLMFGTDYQASVWSAMILCVAGGIWGLKQILFNGARGQGKPEIPFYCELAGLVITGVALVVLLPVWGIEGAAVASLLAYATSMGLAYVLIRPNAQSESDVEVVKD